MLKIRKLEKVMSMIRVNFMEKNIYGKEWKVVNLFLRCEKGCDVMINREKVG